MAAINFLVNGLAGLGLNVTISSVVGMLTGVGAFNNSKFKIQNSKLKTLLDTLKSIRSCNIFQHLLTILNFEFIILNLSEASGATVAILRALEQPKRCFVLIKGGVD